jgi:putative tryptophan/tyrosine transport system substrate-binding protein
MHAQMPAFCGAFSALRDAQACYPVVSARSMSPLEAAQMAIAIGRRRFISALGGGMITWPLAARAQQGLRLPRLGVLVGLPEGDPEGQLWLKALREGLDNLGWKDGINLQIDIRWRSVDPNSMQRLAKVLVDLHPDLINVTTTPATAAVLRETKNVPVVFSVVSDPVGSGFVQSLARPGGNATGFVNIETSVGGKWIELLKEVAPSTSRVLVIFNPKTSPQTSFYLKSMQTAAEQLKVPLTFKELGDASDIEPAIADLARSPGGGLVLTPDSFTGARAQRELIISLAASYRIPTVYNFTLCVRAGGLVSYGTDQPDLQRRAASYVDRILKGEKPANLPVQLPTKFELAVNLKTARALGLTVPDKLLATADQVIE